MRDATSRAAMRSLTLGLLLAGCGMGCGTSEPDIVGPFTGPTHRYYVDSIRVPMTNTEARDVAGDLNGDGYVDNQLGSVTSMQAGMGNVTQHGVDMIAAGVIASSLEIVADDLQNDPAVGVRYLGTASSPAVELGGRIEDGTFRSNLTRNASQPGQAELHLPVFIDADPSLVSAIGMEMELVPDGSGGFDATIHAGIVADEAMWGAIHRAIAQMVGSDPGGHRMMLDIIDVSPRDLAISYEEVRNNGLLQSLLGSDLTIDRQRVVSFGFRAHLRPCPQGACVDDLPRDHCFDRVLGTGETDVDCGGSCRGCQAGATCRDALDCATRSCDDGRCGPPSCTNGVRDGIESDVDCGGPGTMCPRCAVDKRCYDDGDCASFECGEPCIPVDEWDCFGDGWFPSEDTCYPRP